jgi:gamma-glutamyltranspeptidase/glutathione hydrolase
MSIKSVYGRTAAISCSHPSAAAAGWEAFSRGGNVADAALAAAAALTVTLPQASTIGGDAFILYHDAGSNKTYGLNASGLSPKALNVANLTAATIERGPLSVSTPGVVAGWEALHRRFGKLAWPKLFERAIDLAGMGFPASPGLAGATAVHRPLLEKDPGGTEIFLKNGPHKAGSLFKQQALAATLKLISESGAEGFYRGSPAKSIGEYIQRRGGSLSADDFSGTKPDWVEPLQINYRGFDVRVMPPNAYGLYMLLQLAALSGYDFSTLNAASPERYAALIAAARAAFAAGDRYVADPATVGTSTPAPLTEAGLTHLRADFQKRLAARHLTEAALLSLQRLTSTAMPLPSCRACSWYTAPPSLTRAPAF